MKIAIVTPYALPEKGAASMRVDSFAKYFNSKKIKTTILAPNRNNKEGSRLVRRYKNFNGLKKFIKNFDFVILTSPPIKDVFFLTLFLKIIGKPFLIDIRDLAKNGNNPRIKSVMEIISLKLCKKITVVTKFIKNYFIKDYGINQDKIKIVSNGVDTDIIYPSRKRKEIRLKLGIPKNSKVLIYEGVIGGHNLLDFINLLTPSFMKKSNLILLLVLIVGETEKRSLIELQNFEKILKKKGLKDYVRVVKNASPEEMRDYISTSNCGLAPIPSNKKNLYRIPIKVYEYTACKIPILAKGPKGGELEGFVKNNKIGYFSETWGDLLVKLDKNIKRKRIKLNKDFLNSFDRKESAKKMLDFIRGF